MNVIHKIGVILFLLCPYISLYGQEGKDTLTFRIVSYNVENLFDFRHDTLKNDYEFLPDATRHWNYSKYRKKLDNIARVIIATGGWTPPALVALCEVENDSVMRDLTRYSALREADYRYVMTQSPDERGIDVALLYQRNLFKLLSYQSLPVDKPRKNSRPTRDILHVSGLLLNRDTLDVLVAHFPSRSGGARESEPYRLLAARKVKHAIDSLYTIRRHPQIVLLGDFNDYPENKSVKEVLEAAAPSTLQDSLRPQKLYHLLARKTKTRKHFGTYVELNGKRISMTDEDLRKIASEDVEFICDSDAHSVGRVGDFSVPIACIERVGIPYSQIANWERLPKFRSRKKKGLYDEE